jgi:hypothetical protein
MRVRAAVINPPSGWGAVRTAINGIVWSKKSKNERLTRAESLASAARKILRRFMPSPRMKMVESYQASASSTGFLAAGWSQAQSFSSAATRALEIDSALAGLLPPSVKQVSLASMFPAKNPSDKSRCVERLGIAAPNLLVLSETSERIIEQVKKLKPGVLVIDSIQTDLYINSSSVRLRQHCAGTGKVSVPSLSLAKNRLDNVLIGHVD